jgi:hypothetical protein
MAVFAALSALPSRALSALPSRALSALPSRALADGPITPTATNYFARAPSILWFWPVLALLACGLAAWRAAGMRRVALLFALALLVAGCGSRTPPAKRSHPPISGHRTNGGIPQALLEQVRPIGRGPRFEPPVRGRVPGLCTPRLGHRLEAHVEVFGANRVVLLPAGIGTEPPRVTTDGRLTRARCFGNLVTLDPTGTVYFRAGVRLTLGDLFRAWGQTLGSRRIASFSGSRVRVFVNGGAAAGSPRDIALMQRAEIVLEVGPRIPPHSRFSFPAAPPAELR